MNQIENVLEYYTKALSLAQKLVRGCECVTYLDTLSWSERVMSYYYEDVDDIERAIEYRKQLLEMAQYVLTMSSKREYEEYRYHSLCKPGELYVKCGYFNDSISFLEEDLYMEERGFNEKTEKILELLVCAYESINERKKFAYYKGLMNQEKESKHTATKAYNEVLELMRHMARTDIEKFPKDLLDFLKEHSARDYSFKFVSSKAIGSQLSRNALSVLALIGVNFGPEAYQHDKTSEYNKNEKKHRMKQYMSIRQLLLQLSIYEATVQCVINIENMNRFNEVYTLLERLPEKIRSAIQIESLM